MVVVTGASMKPSVTIYNAAGRILSVIPWESDSIAGLGWTGSEDLLIIGSAGEARSS